MYNANGMCTHLIFTRGWAVHILLYEIIYQYIFKFYIFQQEKKNHRREEGTHVYVFVEKSGESSRKRRMNFHFKIYIFEIPSNIFTHIYIKFI